MNCGSPLQWEGLYEGLDNWKKMVTPESFVHPAKMAPRLCERIFEHLEELKMIEQDSTVVDFMAGTGTTNIIASMRGYSSVSIELEPRFVKIEAGNRKRLEGYLGSEPKWRIIQGDSRKLSRFLGNGGVAVMSPSYSMEQKGIQGKSWFENHPRRDGSVARRGSYSKYDNKGNVGNLVSVMSPSYGGSEQVDDRWDQLDPSGRKYRLQFGGNTTKGVVRPNNYQNKKNVGHLKTAIISPPYQNTRIPENPPEAWGPNKIGHLVGKKDGLPLGYSKRKDWKRGDTRQIGNLASVVSPPYQDAISSPKSKDRAERLIKSGRDPKSYMGGTGRQLDTDIRYSKNKTNIGNLRAGDTSPPYFGAEMDGRGRWFDEHRPKDKPPPGMASFSTIKLQKKHDNIAINPETYESAMLQIYREAHRAGISPLVTVTKNPTRKGSLVRLDLITADLLQKSGYRIFDYHQAVLFKSHDESSMNLDGQIDEQVSHKGRIGFFKQLSLKKGNVAANWEDVIFAV